MAMGSKTRRSSAIRYARSVVSSISCAVSTQISIHPRSRTTSASLCSTPKAPGSSSARLPTMQTIGTRSGGVTVRHSMAYIQPTPEEPQKTRAPTVDACLTISNWLCSPSATMYSATRWPLAIFLAMACITVSYGRIGYAVTTSMSASVKASAQASLPEMSISLSSLATCAAFVSTAAMMTGLLCPDLELLALGVFAGDARRDLDTARLELLGDLLLVLPPEAEAVRADGVRLVLDLGGHPGEVAGLVPAPHLPLAGIVVEGRLADHRDAVLHRAHRLADPAAAARVHVGVIQAVRCYVEAGVRTLDPAERAFDARVEVDDRTHRPGRELLEVGVALRHIALATLHRLAHRNCRNRDPLAHLPPLGLLEGERGLAIALGDADRARREALMRLPRGLHLDVRTPLRLADGLTDGLERKELRLDLGEGAQHPRLRVILLEDPEAREGGLGRDEGQVVWRLLLVDVLQELFGPLQRRHQDRAVGNGEPVDGLEAIPGPRFDALGP